MKIVIFFWKVFCSSLSEGKTFFDGSRQLWFSLHKKIFFPPFSSLLCDEAITNAQNVAVITSAGRIVNAEHVRPRWSHKSTEPKELHLQH